MYQQHLTLDIPSDQSYPVWLVFSPKLPFLLVMTVGRTVGSGGVLNGLAYPQYDYRTLAIFQPTEVFPSRLAFCLLFFLLLIHDLNQCVKEKYYFQKDEQSTVEDVFLTSS